MDRQGGDWVSVCHKTCSESFPILPCGGDDDALHILLSFYPGIGA